MEMASSNLSRCGSTRQMDLTYGSNDMWRPAFGARCPRRGSGL